MTIAMHALPATDPISKSFEPASARADLQALPQLWRGRARVHHEAVEATGHAALDHYLPGGGLPRAALTELIVPPGTLELRFLLPLCVRLSAQAQLALVAPPWVPNAMALAAHEVCIQSLWCVQASSDRDALWSAEQLLRAQHFALVVCWQRQGDERASKRLQLAAEQAQRTAILCLPTQARHMLSSAAVRIELKPHEGELALTVSKCRGTHARPSMRLQAPRVASGAWSQSR
jgi:cell division inhibitor SulA/protein ImuA